MEAQSDQNSAPSSDERIAARREGLKLFFDVFKHLTTLSTGAIVLLRTFQEKLSGATNWRPMMPLTFVGYAVSVLGSIPLMLSTARTIRRNEATDQLPDRLGNASYVVAVSGFACGSICLGLFAIRNLWG